MKTMKYPHSLMNNRNIGIISLYKESSNYGGLLQAYALVYVINQMGYNARQIVLGENNDSSSKNYIRKIKEHGLNYAFELIMNRMLNRFKKAELFESDWRETKRLCKEYRDEIPHTEPVDEDRLSKLDDEFDVFVVGSDQVWNPKWFGDYYLLNFTHKNKISYAASMARMDFSDYEKKQLYEAIKDFDWVSLREREAVDFLEKQFNISSSLVLDPTMLLDKRIWTNEERAPEEYSGDEKFIFCYFFNGTKEKRNVAHKEARRTGYKLIYPIWNGETINYNNEEMNEYQIDGVGPREFLWLIHHSEKVLTDSFHGTALSIIFEKQFCKRQI